MSENGRFADGFTNAIQRMAQPVEYNRQTNFANQQAQTPTAPVNGTNLDAELNAVKTTLDQIRANLALIQRDDGDLANGIVGQDQINAGLEVGVTPATEWETDTEYAVNDNVLESNKFYRCLVAHTSGVFATDLAADKWVFQFDFGAEAVAAAASAAAAATSETNAATSASAASGFADNASDSADSAAAFAANILAASAIDGGRPDSNYTSTDDFDAGGVT